uniref:SH3 domain-containing protein n=1 Tax=Eptatretus burgeri TaxID=7764 RepID=A0A8C4Q1Q5_EPTBU
MSAVLDHSVEHQTTFKLSKEDGGIATITEGVRKLRVLQDKGHVWAQKLRLRLKEDSLLLLDPESQDVIERILLEDIISCQEVPGTDCDPAILALTWQPQDQAAPDVYLFSCGDARTDLIQADIQGSLQAYRGINEGEDEEDGSVFESETLSQSSTPPLNTPRSATPPRSHNPTSADLRSRTPSPPSTLIYSSIELISDRTGMLINEQNTGERYQHAMDTEVINRIIGEIELFLEKVQAVREAHAKLNQKGKGSKNPKPMDEGNNDNVKPPVKEDFEDILRKFKHAFNLLGRLNGHIKDPNAEELIQCLIQPLTKVAHIGGPNVAASIIQPLLSDAALTLIEKSLSSLDRGLWKAMGPAWCIQRDKWPADQMPKGLFAPTFADGWTAPPFIYEEITNADVKERGAEEEEEVPKYAKVCTTFISRNKRELSVSQGQLVKVLDNTKRWWRVCGQGGDVGYVPGSFLTLTNEPMNEGLEHHVSETKKDRDRRRSSVLSYVIQGSPPLHRHSTTSVDITNLETTDLDLRRRSSYAGAARVRRPSRVGRLQPNSILAPSFNPDETRLWLLANGFSTIAVDSLSTLGGEEVLSLTSEELQEVCGREGARLYRLIQQNEN